MNPGYVYILTNESMPDLVKIGRTSRDVDLRAAELWQTGVPTRFKVFAKARTCDCVQLEAYMHGDLNGYRVSRSREFFRVAPEKAEERLKFWVELQASEWAHEHFDGVTATPVHLWVDHYAVQELAVSMGCSPNVVARALASVTPSEIAPAVARIIDADRLEQIETLKSIGIPEEEWEGMLNV